MKHVLAILSFLFLTFTSCFLYAQNMDSTDIIIEIPIKVDTYYNEIYIDSIELDKIRLDSKWPSSLTIENLEDSTHCDKNKKVTKSQIDFPFISQMLDTMTLIISDNSNETENKLIIVLGLNDKNELRCFYKSADDIKYKNFDFYNNERFIPLTFILKKKNYEYILWNPFFEEKEEKILGFIKKREPSRFQVILTSGVHNGVSSLKFKPDTATNVKSIYYEAKIINSFNIKLQTLYSVKNLLLGVYISYENNNELNSTRIISQKINGNFFNHTYTSNGNWPDQLLHLGIVAAYDFLVFDNLIISPSVNTGAYFYSTHQKPFDMEFGDNSMKEFKQKYSIGGGIYVKVPVDENLWFTTGFIYHFNHFNASSYFNDINKNTFHSRQEIYRLEIGICLKF